MRDIFTFTLVILAGFVSIIPLLGKPLAALLCNVGAGIDQDCTHHFTSKDFK